MKEKSVVVLPGWGHGREGWIPFSETIGASVLELPGFGAEPQPVEAWGVPEYASWVAEKFEKEPAKSVLFVGHSFGGRVAAHLGSKNPPWLAGLVLVGAPLLYRPTLQTRGTRALAKALKPFLPENVRRMFRSVDAKEAAGTGMGDILARVIPFDQRKTLPHIGVPTLVLHGEKDEDAPVSLAKEAATLIPNARFEMVAGGGHNLHLERPELFYGIVSRFIKSI